MAWPPSTQSIPAILPSALIRRTSEAVRACSSSSGYVAQSSSKASKWAITRPTASCGPKREGTTAAAKNWAVWFPARIRGRSMCPFPVSVPRSSPASKTLARLSEWVSKTSDEKWSFEALSLTIWPSCWRVVFRSFGIVPGGPVPRHRSHPKSRGKSLVGAGLRPARFPQRPVHRQLRAGFKPAPTGDTTLLESR